MRKTKILVFILILFTMLFALAGKNTVGNKYSFFRDFKVEKGQTLEGSCMVIGADLQIDGVISGDAVVIFGKIKVNGLVKGNTAGIGGSIVVGETGVIAGDAAAFMGQVSSGKKSVINGSTSEFGIPISLGVTGFIPVITTALVVMILVMYALACLIYLLLPKRIELISRSLEKYLGRRFLIGFLVNLALIPLIVVLIVTIVGIIVIPVLIVIYFALNILGIVSVFLAIGKRISGGATSNTYISLLSGMLVLYLLSLIPVVGWLLFIGVSMIALGAAIDTRLGLVE